MSYKHTQNSFDYFTNINYNIDLSTYVYQCIRYGKQNTSRYCFSKKLNDIATIRKENGNVYLDKPNINEKGFKIMLLTDLHTTFDQKLLKWTMAGIFGNIKREKPDLVIINGDINDYLTTNKRIHTFARIFEKFGVPWGISLGNHDGEYDISLSRETLIRSLLSYQHCIMTSSPYDIYGYSNYAVHITNGTNVIRSLIVLDSGSYISSKNAKKYKVSKKSYDFIKKSQIDFYEKIVTQQKIENNGIIVPSALVFHIPIPEYKDGYKYGKINYGKLREKVFSSEHNSGLFDAVLRIGSTDNIYVGHDHSNDYSVEYKGVNLTLLKIRILSF